MTVRTPPRCTEPFLTRAQNASMLLSWFMHPTHTPTCPTVAHLSRDGHASSNSFNGLELHQDLLLVKSSSVTFPGLVISCTHRYLRLCLVANPVLDSLAAVRTVTSVCNPRSSIGITKTSAVGDDSTLNACRRLPPPFFDFLVGPDQSESKWMSFFNSSASNAASH